jgi:hypothetical protein
LSAGEHQAQLEWEARVGRTTAAAAITAALCTLAAAIVQAIALGDAPDGDRGALIAIDRETGLLWTATTLRDIGVVLLAFVLLYLYRVTRYRQQLPGLIGPLIPLAPVLLVIASILGQLDLMDLADEFTSSGPRSENRAEDLLDERSALGPAISAGGTLALALTLVLLNLNAMRAGLLSRFMGIIGILTGALLVLPLSPLPIVQIFWLAALGALFLGRWPGSRGPAWETGEAVPWPTLAAAREQAVGEQLRNQPEPEANPEAPSEEAAEQHPVSKKRKRKRRR